MNNIFDSEQWVSIWEWLRNKPPLVRKIIAYSLFLPPILFSTFAIILGELPGLPLLIKLLITIVIAAPYYIPFRLVKLEELSMDPFPHGNHFSPIRTKIFTNDKSKKNEKSETTQKLRNRNELVDKLESILTSSESAEIQNSPKFLFLSGASGAGKSSLIELLVKNLKRAKNNNLWEIPEPLVGFSLGAERRVEKYFTQKIQPAINKGKESNKHVLIVIDQLEQFQEEFIKRDLISHIQDYKDESNITWIFVIRKDFFYNLRFFNDKFRIFKPEEELQEEDKSQNEKESKNEDKPCDNTKREINIDVFANTLHIPGLNFPITFNENETNNPQGTDDSTKQSADIVDFYEHLRTAYIQPEHFDKISEEFKKKEILPLEYNMVGFMLEDLRKCEEGPTYINKKIRKYFPENVTTDYLIYRYFLRYLFASGDFETAKVVLFALSANGTLTETNTEADLADICRIDKKSIRRVLNNLVKGGIIEELDDSTFRLMHDYLAHKYNALSTHLLDPIERDNIKLFSDEVRNCKSSEGKSQTKPFEKMFSNKFPNWATTIYILIFLVLIVRLFAPSFSLRFPEFYIQNSLLIAYYKSLSGIIDIGYLPSFISSLISGIYVWSIYRYFFSRMKEFEFLSFLVIILCGIFILAGTVIIHGWLTLACFGGTLVAFRFVLSYAKAGTQWMSSKANSQRKTARLTFVSMIIIAIIFSVPLFWLSYFYNANNIIDSGIYIALLEYIVSLTFFWFMLINFKNQATSYMGAFYLGVWARMKLTT